MKHPQLVRLKRSDYGVQESSIVKQDEVAFLPVLRVDQLTAHK